MQVAIAADHGGFELKKAIINHFSNLEWLDLGTYSADSVDYPDYANSLAKCILAKEAGLGILICGTGVGASIAANRHKGIRAALVYNNEVARLAKEHNNANILVFGGRTMQPDDVFQYINTFMQAEFAGERHQRRLNKLDAME